MKYLKKINEAFLKNDKRKAVDLIISYIVKNSNIDLYEYDETWHIQKEDVFLEGQLFVGLRSSKGVRINWKRSDFSSEIHSIDVWNDFEFDTNPDFTISIGNVSVSKNLKKILDFIKSPSIGVKEELDTDGYDPRTELAAATKRLARLKSAKSIEIQKRKIEQLEAAIAFDEKAETDSTRIMDDDDLKIDVFKSIELYTIQVARGKSNSLIISGMAGVGKCHGKGTKILMYDGTIRNVEDVKKGDLLMGNDSTARSVLSLGRGSDNIYKISSKGWDDFTVNSEHILYIRRRDRKENTPIEISVKEFLKMSASMQSRYQLIRTGVEFEEKHLKMNPYLMGVWLGDGSRRDPSIETADIEIVEYLQEEAIKYNLLLKEQQNKKSKSNGYYFTSGSKGKGLKLHRNDFINELNFYELFKCSEKFIPNDYLINSSENRKKLLAGLIDSDGYQFHKSYSISTKWKNLAEQIVFLSRSLGFRSFISVKKIKGKDYFNINISGDLSDIPIKLKRKQSEKRKQIKNVLYSSFKISEIGYDEYYGFELDKNHLYLLGDFTITHNTRVVKDTLTSLGMKKDEHYYFATGTATTAGLYEIIFKNRHRLVVFDDCDSVFKDDDSVNILKGALDTYDVREISKISKGSIFDSTGMDDTEIQQKYDDSGKLPNRFEFSGQIIFISNLPESKFDDALLSRSLHVDVHLNKKELFDRMKDIMTTISPEVSMDKKEEALEYLSHVTNHYPTKFDLNLRTLIHSINLRANNEDTIKFGQREEFTWKLLIKKYLVKSKNI